MAVRKKVKEVANNSVNEKITVSIHEAEKVAATNELENKKFNQCDGCMSNIPILNGIHREGNEMGFFCTRDRYL